MIDVLQDKGADFGEKRRHQGVEKMLYRRAFTALIAE